MNFILAVPNISRVNTFRYFATYTEKPINSGLIKGKEAELICQNVFHFEATRM